MIWWKVNSGGGGKGFFNILAEGGRKREAYPSEPVKEDPSTLRRKETHVSSSTLEGRRGKGRRKDMLSLKKGILPSW